MEVAEERERGRGKNRIWIKNGIVYDPLNGIEGERKDIFIENGVIVEELSGKAEKILDVSGKVVLPAGIDCLLYTSPSPRDGLLSRMPSSA